MAKCILLVRVSTHSKKQELSLREQEAELLALALSKGYKEEDIIPICKQESALKRRYVKTNEEKDEIEIKQQGLQEMEEAIKKDSSINCVFSWEISRISRRKKVLFDELEFLTDRKIQLIIAKPYIELLNPDGSINSSSEMLFSMFSSLADAEMRNKLDRFQRTKESKRKEGKYVGGWKIFGYDVEPTTKKFIINEEEAAIVREMFKEYLTGNVSMYKLADELQERGIINYNSRHSAFTFVGTILKNYAYAGLPSSVRQKDRKMSGNIYPAIVTKEMVDKAIEIAAMAKYKPKTNVKNIYYCKGLLKCANCGRRYVARLYSAIYRCSNEVNNCNNPQISINIADSLLWYVAITLKSSNMLHKTEEDKVAYQEQLKVLDSKLQKVTEDIATNKTAYTILNKRIIMQKVTEEEGEELERELDIKRDELNKKLVEYTNKVANIEQILFEMSNKFNEVNIDNIANIQDDSVRYQIIHEVIDSCLVERVANGVVKLEIIVKKYGYSIIYYVTTRNRKIFDSNFNVDEAYTYNDEHLVNINMLERYHRNQPSNKKEYQKEYYEKNKRKIMDKNNELRRKKREAEKRRKAEKPD